MIKKVILINSANFSFLEIDLHKDLFFLGDNGSGKTSAIRAIHYLYSGDVRHLGIPSDKEGFKEYYFKYANSYIIYVFEDFFIFMYKTSGEIVKIFSKQVFKLDKVIDENNNLYELDQIKKYTREAHLRKTVKGVGEYRDIIYGNNKKLLDFKFTSVKNTETFIGLFNEIFNIDKSIIDAASIKRAIQTTLEYSEKSISFNHEEYLQSIYQFQNDYRFFSDFEKQKGTIDDIDALKSKLLDLEEKIVRSEASIAYRYTFEKSKELEYNTALNENDHAYKNAKKMLDLKTKILHKWQKKVQIALTDFEYNIALIEQLKVKFSSENLLKNRDEYHQLMQREQKQRSLSESYLQLTRGISSALEVIEKEIRELKYKRDVELLRTLKEKLENKSSTLYERLNDDKNRLRLEFEAFDQKNSLDIKALSQEVESFKKEIADIEREINRLLKSFRVALKENHNLFNQKRDEQLKEQNQNLDLIAKKKREIDAFEFDKSRLHKEQEIELQDHKKSFLNEKRLLEDKILEFEVMVHSKPNSFKEFLSNEVDAWEKRLYPILDAKLLEMDIETLQPKILREDMLVGLDFNYGALKSILTVGEAEIEIKALSLQKEALKESYEHAQEQSTKQYQEQTNTLDQKIAFLHVDIEALEQKNIALKNSLDSLDIERDAQEHLLEKKLEEDQHTLEQQKNSMLKEIEITTQDMRQLQKLKREKEFELSEQFKDAQSALNEELALYKQALEETLHQEQKKIEIAIALKIDEKNALSQDEKIAQLEEEMQQTEKEIERSKDAKRYLDAYEDKKALMDTLVEIKAAHSKLQIANQAFTQRLEEKLDHYAYQKDRSLSQKEEIQTKLRGIKRGLREFDTLELVIDDLKEYINDEYLYKLIETYKSEISAYKNSKITLKERLSKLKNLKNRDNELDIHFNFNELDENDYISEAQGIIDKIDEIVEYKNKKLEVLKRMGHKRFDHFVHSVLPTTITVFNDGEDKFFSQVAKINKNLKGIDFGVIKEIRIETKIEDKKSIAKLLNELREIIAQLTSLLHESSLFYDKKDVIKALSLLESKFLEIKKELKGDAISLQDTIDLSLSFNENGKQIDQVAQLKNESSTGGSMLLKIALAISILELFLSDEETPFFLIVDEVSRLHSENQEKLRAFANTKGFGIIFVTPEPTYSKPDLIKYYRFRKSDDHQFFAVELNI